MILPPATLGLLGGGQLGHYFIAAAHEMGYRVLVIDPDRNCPSARIADEHIVADYDNVEALARMLSVCSAVTTEFENVPAATLAYLAKSVRVCPSAEAVAICQNRSAEKDFLRRHNFPHAPYANIHTDQDVRDAESNLFPGILKVLHFGYDGKGQARVSNHEEALAAFQQFKGAPCVLEKMLALDYEVSVVLARDDLGNTQCFPASENSHRDGVLDISSVSASEPMGLTETVASIAKEIAEKLNYVGTLAVEFFVVQGQLYVNEMAPRPHNSGHYTIDACTTNQYEQQVRALCRLPLDQPKTHSAAVMVNLLGDLWFANDSLQAQEPDWHKLLSVPNLKLHLYGKHHARPGRKMGHFTVLGDDLETLRATALAARAAILPKNHKGSL